MEFFRCFCDTVGTVNSLIELNCISNQVYSPHVFFSPPFFASDLPYFLTCQMRLPKIGTKEMFGFPQRCGRITPCVTLAHQWPQPMGVDTLRVLWDVEQHLSADQRTVFLDGLFQYVPVLCSTLYLVKGPRTAMFSFELLTFAGQWFEIGICCLSMFED